MPFDPTSAEAAAVLAHARAMAPIHLRDLMAAEPDRFARMHLRVGTLLCDYSKHRIDQKGLSLLFALAQARGVPQAISAMFAGERINTTEKRPALHVALRAPKDVGIVVDGQDVVPQVHRERQKMREFVARVHEQRLLGFDGQPLRHVIHLGIGGSDLGPVMATEALRPLWHQGVHVDFVSNVDGAHLQSALKNATPGQTLFVVASKTFTTQETMANAHSAKAWLLQHGMPPQAVGKHFVGLSSNPSATAAFGIDESMRFSFWPWVGGRYSMWSAVGLSIALAVGNEHFDALLDGAHRMDRHFATAPLAQNMPVLLALLGHWYIHGFGAATHAVLPYAQHLHRLPAYLQQLDMESNGKSVQACGSPVRGPTGPILWGEPGTNGQHAFYQLLHQGTHLVPADFIVCKHAMTPLGEHHRLLVANCLAQSAALMRGRTLQESAAQLQQSGHTPQAVDALAPHRVFSGNKPSTTLVLERLDATHLGQLVALYEHKVFVQGVLWGVNSFDQWGVELGKELAQSILQTWPEVEKSPIAHDASTQGLMQHLLASP